ncbi:receptor-like protein 7 [Magnolia sinica]|uniref:receptor-like protein 7 n=1 Tax=Magnolia sinica TaxID=86752 RepID=UPI002657FD33|nr:receptor-like protein 7 [Magnolia sinica]
MALFLSSKNNPAFLILFFLSSLLFLTTQQCNHHHFSALLHLKHRFNFIDDYTLSTLPSWNSNNTDCCTWERITCDGPTGHVISLDLSELYISGRIDFESLFRLQSLQRLNLAYNYFDHSPFPSGFDQLTRLTHLNLSSFSFYGQIPLEISRLTSLVSLDLSFNEYWNGSSGKHLKLENPSIGAVVQNLSNLSELYLDWVHILLQGQTLDLPLPTLRKLSLRECECGLHGKFPESVFQLPNLQIIEISGNPLVAINLPEFPQNNTLQILILSGTGFSGKIPDSVSNLKFLSKLDLSNCNLSGSLPSSLSNLTKLQFLDLSHNRLSGPIPSSYGNELQNLKEITLWNNLLNGTIPSSLFSLSSLLLLDLRGNQLSGQLGEFHNASSSQLEFLHLDSNKLQGMIPRFIFQLTKLQLLHLSSNNFSGVVELGLFQNLKNLNSLDLSDNNLSVQYGSGNSTFVSIPQFQSLLLCSCNISTFPNFLRNQVQLMELDLSYNKISGEIPKWIWEVGNGSLISLNLSHNVLQGIKPSPHLLLSDFQFIDLSFNMLKGSLPIPSPSVLFFSVSNNSLGGEIPRSVCNATSLTVLDLSHNHFIGQIPSCLGEIGDALSVLNLQGNAFNGTLLQTFKEGCNIQMLDLSGNQLEGRVPRSLANCKMLEVLNLGNNQIHDTFPLWLGALSQLRVLILRSNQFHGAIGHPLTNHPFPLLQIFDLSFNSFEGNLPSNMFKSWKAMMEEDKSQSLVPGKMMNGSSIYYQNKVSLLSKGLMMEVVKILTTFTVVDLLGNKFDGDIPESIGDLKSLHVLNMSNNYLTGRIPISFKNLRDLESLDLSQNKLLGEFPWKLTELTFLEGSLPIPSPSIIFLSVSNNSLSGEIPLSVCNAKSLTVLDLSYNRFIGQIPPCFSEIGDALIVLNLQGNAFNGTLLQTFKEGCNIQTLDLSENQLEGQVPRSLANCKVLEVLNLGNNHMHDTFPLWMEAFSYLRILVLRSNQFHGTIGHPLTNNPFPLLQIIDLSSNCFEGNLPSNMFKSWKAMMGEEKSQSSVLGKMIKGSIYYQNKVSLVNKGLQMELVKILTAFTVVDLSENKFQGDIPESIGDLKSLHVLNMSNNYLTGRIPTSFEKLRDLESLDLSQNKLSGEIPWQLAELTFLEVLNLSQNLLVGTIPQSRQFLTFNNESFKRNLGLCGPPLSNKCEDAKSAPSPTLSTSHSERKYDWELMWLGFGVGYGVGVGMLFWTLALWRKGRREFYIFVDGMLSLIFPSMVFSK